MPARRIRFDEYEADFARRELRKCGHRVGLQHKPFRVLELLLRRPGELVTREELFRFLWPDSHVSFEHSLNTAVNALRQALGESSRNGRFIETRTGVGYRFCAPVEEMPETAGGQRFDAYEDYLKGRYFLDRMSEDEIYKAIAFFNAATADKRCFSLAHAGIADAYCQLALLSSARSSIFASKARNSAELAFKRQPDLADAHIAAGRVKIVFDCDCKGAQEAVTCALALAPNTASPYVFQAFLLCTSERYEEAEQMCCRAVIFDPLSFPANLQLAACLYAERDFEGAADQCWKILTLAPRFAPAQIMLALTYEQLGLHEEALVEFRNAQSAAVTGIQQVLAMTGLNKQAEQELVKRL